MQADIVQLPVRRPAFQETTSLGAALAAGLAVGMYSPDQVFREDTAEGSTVFVPKLEKQAADMKYASWKTAVQKSFGLADLA
jgi:glycerol kinase